MKATDLVNRKKETFETVETFAKRVYDTAKRIGKSMIFTPSESWRIIDRLAKYYDESPFEIISAIGNLELSEHSEKYRIQWVKCLGEHYLIISERD